MTLAFGMINISPSISATDNATLLLPVTLEEMHAVLNSIGSLKAPGPDGLHALFFRRFWPHDFLVVRKHNKYNIDTS